MNNQTYNELIEAVRSAINTLQLEWDKKIVLLIAEGNSPQILMAEKAKQIFRRYPNSVYAFTQDAKGKFGDFYQKEYKEALSVADTCLDAIVFLQLGFITMSKIAEGIADDIVTKFAMEALLHGKPIIAASDCCNPSVLNCNTGYKKLMQNKFIAAQSYGVEFVPLEKLPQSISHILSDSNFILNKHDTKNSHEKTDVVTLSDLTDSKLHLKSGAIITPAAQDEIIRKGIQIISHGG